VDIKVINQNKLGKEVVMVKPMVWKEAVCPVCGKTYEYGEIEGDLKPETCGMFDCLYKFMHEPQYKEIRDKNPLYSN